MGYKAMGLQAAELEVRCEVGRLIKSTTPPDGIRERSQRIGAD